MYLYVDDEYWDIPASQLVRTGNINVNQQGLYTLRYNAVDGSGNKADEFFVQVFVRDVIPPVIVLNGSSAISVDVFGTFNDPGVTATDNITQNPNIVTDRAQVLNMNKLGTYTITYTAIDAAGNRASVQRMVIIVDKVKPIITILGSNPMYVERNSNFDSIDPGVKITDNYWPENTMFPTLDKTQLDMTQDGPYYIYYNTTDSSGNKAVEMFRLVIVTPPVGLNDLMNNEVFEIYPNPSAGKYYVSFKKMDIKSLQVYDMLGSLVLSKEVNAMQSDFDMSTNKHGIYIVRFTSIQGQQYHTKITLTK
jgi:hypothetical protein